MAGVPTSFQAFSNVLSNYNFVDIASGTGYINFYLGTTVDLKLISNFSYYADTILDSGSDTNPGDLLRFDHDYDTLMNRPLDVSGLGIVNVPVYIQGSSQSGYVIAILRKWDGVTETDIVTNTSRVSTPATPYYDMLSIDLNVPLTHFKKGEYLRLTIQLHTTNSSGTTRGFGYAHDPKGRTTGWDTTGAVPSILMFQCPVRLNL